MSLMLLCMSYTSAWCPDIFAMFILNQQKISPWSWTVKPAPEEMMSRTITRTLQEVLANSGLQINKAEWRGTVDCNCWSLGRQLEFLDASMSRLYKQMLIFFGFKHCPFFPASFIALFFSQTVFPQIALAIGVLTSSWGLRVRRFCGFVAGGAVTQGVVGGVVWCV